MPKLTDNGNGNEFMEVFQEFKGLLPANAMVKDYFDLTVRETALLEMIRRRDRRMDDILKRIGGTK